MRMLCYIHATARVHMQSYRPQRGRTCNETYDHTHTYTHTYICCVRSGEEAQNGKLRACARHKQAQDIDLKNQHMRCAHILPSGRRCATQAFFGVPPGAPPPPVLASSSQSRVQKANDGRGGIHQHALDQVWQTARRWMHWRGAALTGRQPGAATTSVLTCREP